MKTLCAAAALTLLLADGLDAQQAATAVDARLAQLTLPTGSGADWRQWDSFFNNIVEKLATDLPDSRRAQLQDLFLDSRYQLVQTLSVSPSDPVPSLFLDTWSRLSPILNQSMSALSPQVVSQYKGFVTAMDSAASLTSLDHRFGLVQVTPDMLRGASKLLGTGGADPLAYVLDVDYNGGPRALGRYRSAGTIPALKKVDEAFWAKFRSVSAGKEMGVKSCYGS